MTAYWPNGSLTRPRVSSDFNPARKNPVTGIVQPHNGIDLIGWADVVSPVDGTVVFAGYNGGAGNEVRIRADGPTAFHVGDYYRLLHHASLYVRTGERVEARQPVGRMGTTGQSTGVHCHFETHEWRLWNPVNPTDYMARANAGGTPAGGGGSTFPTPEDTLSAQEVAEIKAHVTAEANRTIVDTAQRVLTFVIPSYIAGETPASLGKLIRAFWQKGFTKDQRSALATGYEPGVRLVRYARSVATGNVFALYEGADGAKYRYQIEDFPLDVAPFDQPYLWGFDRVIPTDFVEAHPGELFAHVKSEATGNVFALYRTSLGHVARYQITDPAEIATLGPLPVMAHGELLGFADVNQGI